MKKSLLIAMSALTLALSGAATAKKKEESNAAGGANSTGGATLERCDAPMGTLAVVEDTESDWYSYLTTDLRLPALTPVLRMYIQQSNCFVVVERGRALDKLMNERALAESGEVRSGSSMGKGQMVAADYYLNPTITFNQSDAGGIGGALAGFGGRVGAIGAVVGGLKFKKASTILTLIDTRSGVQLAAAEGNSKKTSFAIGGVGFGGALGGYSNTPEGKVIAAAFGDAYNKLVIAVKNYKAQEVEGGLGKGGKLKVGG